MKTKSKKPRRALPAAPPRRAPQSQPPAAVRMGTPTSVKATIAFVCGLLRDVGIAHLSPEALRQAKFDGDATQPLWAALHDVVALQLSGWPAAGGAALAALHADARAEGLTGEEDGGLLPPEGA
jgi:hypothetical protein